MDAGESEYTTVVVVLDWIDTFVIIFFTFEYFVRYKGWRKHNSPGPGACLALKLSIPRFACAPKKWRFFRNPMNMVDLFAIIPFYLAIFLNQVRGIFLSLLVPALTKLL